MSAYLVAAITRRDAAGYAEYEAIATPTVFAHGGRGVASAQPYALVEGTPPAETLVLLQFPSLDALHGWYADPEYQRSIPHRHASADSVFLATDGVSDARDVRTEAAGSAPPAYVVAWVTVTNPELYQQYSIEAGKTVVAHGGRRLSNFGSFERLEGGGPWTILATIEFPNLPGCLAWYRSPEYQQALALRLAASNGALVIVEGRR